MKLALQEIRAERERQITVENWSEAHDDGHAEGEMLQAAVIYLWHGTDKAAPLRGDGSPVGWPWEPQWWKPKDRRRNLVRAGALCLAEIGRINRKWKRQAPHGDGLPDRLRKPDRDGPFTGHVDHKLNLAIRELGIAHAAGSEP